MNNLVKVLVLSAFLIVAAATAAPSQAQGPANLPKLFGSFAPQVGVWAEYGITEKTSGDEVRMRLSIVGKEGDAHWYEIVNDLPQGRSIIKMLVTGDPNENAENIKRMIIKGGNTPAMEMPREMVLMGRRMAGNMFESRRGVPARGTEDIKIEKIGSREVTVPAGTFKTVQYRLLDRSGAVLGSYDSNDDIPPFGLVLSEAPEAKMTLLGYGKDAVSAITEEPALMPMPPGIGTGRPPGPPPAPPPGVMPPSMPQGMPQGMGDSPPGR